MIETSGNIRIDLLGGTLDIRPISLILKNTVTLNAALALKSTVKIEDIKDESVLVDSSDYNQTTIFDSADFTVEKLSSDFFGRFKFIALILNHFHVHSRVKMTIASGSPPGAGLGGSSTLGVALYKALCLLTKRTFDAKRAVEVLNSIEAQILDSGPAGYQDYFPAIYGGILALKPTMDGTDVTQLHSKHFKNTLEKNLTLVYSGQTRLSGINNWEIYKKFFDKDRAVRRGLQEIADLSNEALHAAQESRFGDFIQLMKKEGGARKKLFPNIVTPAMEALYKDCQKQFPDLGLKICGAGGGGCFLLIGAEGGQETLKGRIEKAGMECLDISIEGPKKQSS